MSTGPERLLLGLVIAGTWLTVLPAVASADDCATRAARITAGQVPSNEADPDCKKAAVLGTTVAVAGASTAVGVAAVKLGLGGGPGGAKPPGGGAGPVVTGLYSGPEAIDILVKSGLATVVKDAKGNPVWEPGLQYPNGDPVPRVKPAAGFDNLGGNPVSRVVGQSIDPATGRTDQVQTQTITGVTGFGGRIRPDGTIDPNVSITVDQGRAPKDGFPWTPPVEPPDPAATPPPPGPPTTPPTPPTTPPTPPTTPPTPPPTPQTTTVPVPPQTTPQPPPGPQTTTPQTSPPQTAKPPAKPVDLSKIPTNVKGERIPGTPDQVAASVMAPGTTLIPTDVGGFLGPDGSVVNYPGGVPDFVKGALSKGAKVDTSGGRVTLDVKVNPVGALAGGDDPFGLKGLADNLPTVDAHVGISAQGGKLTVTAPKGDPGSQGLATVGNQFFNSEGGPNGQWAQKGLDLRSLSTVTDPATGKTYIKVDVVPRK